MESKPQSRKSQPPLSKYSIPENSYNVRNNNDNRIGKWLPPSHDSQLAWLRALINHVDKSSQPLHPVLQEFAHLIETNAKVYMLVTSMLRQVPEKKPYKDDPTGAPQIRDYRHLLQLLNHLLTTAPAWSDGSYRIGLIGLPINAVLDWSMGTSSGFAAFLDPDINGIFKKILTAWGEFLKSSQSAAVLDDSDTGWFGETGLKDLTAAANVGGTKYPFEKMFVCDPGARFYGYKSWDDFFTRRFRDGIRPVASPDDGNVIVNACESTPYRIERDVGAREQFWLKNQPYSVMDMLANDELAPNFVGGTVYQAFLSSLSYHRWHSPVSGKVVKRYIVDGTYYSEPLYEGVGNIKVHVDKAVETSGEMIAQAYITAVATRGLIFIEADNPAIGLVAFIGVGMAEVSTCDITVKEGDHLQKGDELGMFHFGGSTHCLLFRKGVNLTGFPELGGEENMPVNSQLAVL